MMPAKGTTSMVGASEPLALPLPQAASTPLLGSSPGVGVDCLVHEIKENLKLGSCLPLPPGSAGSPKAGKAGASFKLGVGRAGGRGHHRASPYAVPPTSRVGGLPPLGNCDSAADRQSQLRKWNHQRRRYPSTCKDAAAAAAASGELDDPLEMLQELLAEGSLVKEAVRRLQLGLSPKLTAAAANTGSSANRSFYDSDEDEDEDCRTPPAAYSELCQV